MEIRQINSNSSFGMAWDKAAKKALTVQIAKLPKRKIGQAIELVNKLEQSSVNHTLSLNTADRVILAEGRGGAPNSFAKQYSDRGFLRTLKDTDKFITRANEKFPKAMQMKEELLKGFDFLKKPDAAYYGIRIDEKDVPFFAENLAITNAMQKSPKSAEEIIGQLKRIYEKAKGINADIGIGATGDGAVLNKAGHDYLNRHIVSYNEPVGVQHLDDIEKVIDEQIAYIAARDAEISSPSLKSEKSGKATSWIGNRFKNSKIGKILSSIKEEIEEKAFQKRLIKYFKKKEKLEKISEAIKIG